MLRHPVRSGFVPLVTLFIASACSLNEPPTIVLPLEPDAGKPPVTGNPTPPVRDAGTTPPVMIPEEMLPSSCTNGESRACGPATEAGECVLGTRICIDGVWGDCLGAVLPSTRLCAEREDRDCDGLPDDTTDAVCECVPGSAEPCETHPGLDGVGTCKAGQRLCVAAPDGQSSRWGECTGSVGPLELDSCLVRGDDANCDAIPNGNCACIEGEVVPCGPSDLGICRKGTSTCVDLKFTECKGAVLPEARDCSSEDDNDCDGTPDNTIDDECTCEVESVEACSTHPQDGVGVCRPGSRTCVAGKDGSTSAPNTCTGAVAPGPRRCNAATDNDCNGIADNTIDTVCKCVIGTTQLCEQHPGLDGVGRCRPGQQLCTAGPDNTSSTFAACSGSFGPAAADSCTTPNDDNCDGIPNGGCECVGGAGNLPCADTPATSRCDATGKCVACAVNADCSLVKGLPVCNVGVCVQCTTDAQCGAGALCNLTSNTCAAAPPPPAPPEPAPAPATKG